MKSRLIRTLAPALAPHRRDAGRPRHVSSRPGEAPGLRPLLARRRRARLPSSRRDPQVRSRRLPPPSRAPPHRAHRDPARRSPQGPAQGPDPRESLRAWQSPRPSPGSWSWSRAGSPAARAAPPACPADSVASTSAPGPVAAGAPTRTTRPSTPRLSRQPRLVPRSDAIVRRLTGWGDPAELRAGISDTASDWQHPTYYPSASDPVFKIHCTEELGHLRGRGHAVRIPDAARAGRRPRRPHDRRRPGVGWEYDLWQVTREARAAAGRLVTSLGRTHADRRGRPRIRRHRGSLRPPAPAASGPRRWRRGQIDHALFMLVRCDSGKAVFRRSGGAACSDRVTHPRRARASSSTSRTAEITPCGCPDGRRRSSARMSEYGLYVGDTTGGTPWNIWFESGSTYTSFGKVDPMVTFARQAGIPRSSDGKYYFDWGSGIDWRQHLKVVAPCEAQQLLLRECLGAGFAPAAQQHVTEAARVSSATSTTRPGRTGSSQSVSVLPTDASAPSSPPSPSSLVAATGAASRLVGGGLLAWPSGALRPPLGPGLGAGLRPGLGLLRRRTERRGTRRWRSDRSPGPRSRCPTGACSACSSACAGPCCHRRWGVTARTGPRRATARRRCAATDSGSATATAAASTRSTCIW